MPKKSFRERVASNLDRVSFLGIWLLFMIFLFSVIGIYLTESITIGNSIQVFFLLFCYSLMIFSLIFSYYIESRIISKVGELSASSKYCLLTVYPLYLKTLVFSLLFLIIFLISWQAVGTYSLIALALYKKLNVVVSFFPIFFFIYAGFQQIAFMSVKLWNRRVEIEISFNVIQDFENIAFERTSKYQKVHTGQVWSQCLKRIVSYLEDRFQRVMCTSRGCNERIYEQFDIVSLAALTGDVLQRKIAKEWIEKLGNIVTEKRLPSHTKNKLIIEHLQKVKTIESFESLRKIHNDFGFHHEFESGWRKVNKVLTKTERMILLIISISTFILSVVLPLLLP